MGERGATVQAADLSVVFRRGAERITALDAVGFSLDAGEFVGISGPSGSGKTTLLNVVGALQRPTEGHVALDGQDLYGLSDRTRARLRNEKVGFIFQTYHLHPMLTVRQNVELPFAFGKRRHGEGRPAANRMLEALGLAELAGARAGDLSSGQKQRVVVARALATAPALVLADEPTANLDEENARLVVDALWQASHDHGATVLMVSHQGGSFDRASRTLRVEDGRLAR